jgi:hypothetical protein
LIVFLWISSPLLAAEVLLGVLGVSTHPHTFVIQLNVMLPILFTLDLSPRPLLSL